MFERTLIAGWGDMDFNAHMRNTAYLDKSADVRMLFFESCGFPIGEFHRLRIGPVIRKDELVYSREVGLLEPIRVTLEVAGMSADGSHWILRNTFFKSDAQRAATVMSTGGWLDLTARKLVVPPPALFEAMRSLGRAPDFRELETSIK